MKVPALLKNKYVLYVLLIVALLNVLGYIALEDYNSLALFVVVGLLSTYFSKNMCVTLLVAISVASLVAINKNVLEGFEEGNKNKDDKKDSKKADDSKKSDFSCGKDKDGNATVCPSGTTCTQQSQCVKKENFKNNVPSSKPAQVDSDDSVGDRIDYAATMEQAYDNLQKMLGEDGMKSITSETKKLVEQQKDLMGSLNQMAPVLNSAKETLANLNIGDMESMGNILKGFNSKAQPKKK